MYAAQTKIVNPTGLHARPASDFALKAKGFESKVYIKNLDDAEAETVSAKSIVSILSQGISCGAQVEVSAEGADELVAVESLVKLIASGFGE